MKAASHITFAAAALLLFSSCYQVPVSGRRAVNLVDRKEVERMSAEEFERMKGSYRPSRNRAHIDQLQRVGQRLSAVVSIWDMGGAEWEWVVFDAPNDVNAFAMAGGKVGVFSGIFKLVENDSQLASIIAHEIAHVTSRHVEERLSTMLATESLAVVGAVTTGGLGGGAYLAAMGMGAMATPFDRGKEIEADQIGMIYMAEAGYDPREAIKVLEKLDVMENGTISNKMMPDWGDSHPTNPARIAKMYEILPRAMAIYEAKAGPVNTGTVVR